MTIEKPAMRPANPRFSSGPCAKIPGWTPDTLKTAFLGRSHRASDGKLRLKHAIDLTREVLQVPDDYLIAIVPASDTGAVEMAMWNLLGERGVDMLAWESFGEGWITDAVKQLKLADVRLIKAGYGELPDMSEVDFDRDVVFTWNGTTSGVRVPNGDFIPAGRAGLTICDATSAAFAQPLDFAKLDVVTYSWQKVLGGEGGHGMLILSPRAVAAPGDLYAGMAAAEDFPAHQGRQDQCRHLPGRNHQHPLHAVRRRLYQGTGVGAGVRRPERNDGACRCQCRCTECLGGSHGLD